MRAQAKLAGCLDASMQRACQCNGILQGSHPELCKANWQLFRARVCNNLCQFFSGSLLCSSHLCQCVPCIVTLPLLLLRGSRCSHIHSASEEDLTFSRKATTHSLGISFRVDLQARLMRIDTLLAVSLSLLACKGSSRQKD